MSKPKKPFSVRLPPEQLEQLKKQGIDLTPLIQDFVAKLVKQNTCPTCGKELEHERVKR